jgi:hypothetical protein
MKTLIAICFCGLSISFVLAQPVPIDRLGALSGELDFLGAAVTSQPLHEFCRSWVRREVRTVQRVRHANVAALTEPPLD